MPPAERYSNFYFASSIGREAAELRLLIKHSMWRMEIRDNGQSRIVSTGLRPTLENRLAADDWDSLLPPSNLNVLHGI